MSTARRTIQFLLPAIAGLLFANSAMASYTVSLNDGNESNWQTLYAQGFSTSLGATPAPGANVGDPVTLSSFSFFKSGTADSATNIQLAIFNTLFPNFSSGQTTASANFVGLSTTIIPTTTVFATGAAETFNFNNLPLVYGNDYAAYFVNVGVPDLTTGVSTLTPVLVSAMAVNYADPTNSGTFHPVVNYGTETQFQYATGNFLNNGFLSDFSFAGDAGFVATLNTAPEPASLAMIGMAGLALAGRRRK
jgi:hypothetical protein